MYDPALGRWHCSDPLAEAAYGWSPYRYAYNNPMRFIDPNGMLEDNYGIDDDGNIDLLEETDDDYDVLYAVDDQGNKQDTNGDQNVSEDDGVKVEDQSLLPSLSETDSEGISQATTSENNSTDALSVFKFAADNSSVEWGLHKFDEGNGVQYTINTRHDEDHSPARARL